MDRQGNGVVEPLPEAKGGTRQAPPRGGRRRVDSAPPPAVPHTVQTGTPGPHPEPASRPRPRRPRKAFQPRPATDESTANAPPTPAPTPTRTEALQALVARANAGDKNALVGLRQLLDGCPEIWSQLGDLARHAETAWLDLISGGDRLVVEAAKRRMAHLKSQLAGPAPTPLESLLIDQIGVTYLASSYAEAASATPGKSCLGEAHYRLRHAESAQKRHLAAMRTLATLRALVPQGLTPARPARRESVAPANAEERPQTAQ